MPLMPRTRAFGTGIRGRDSNDSMNSDREAAIEILFSPDSEVRDLLLRDSSESDEWGRIRREFEKAINGFMRVGGYGVKPTKGNICSVKRLGGRGRNFDFEGTFVSPSGDVTLLKLELKRGESIYDQPQFLQLYARDGNMVTRSVYPYAEWFYENYLVEVGKLAGTKRPLKSEYLRYCFGTDYDALPHTRVLYQRLVANDVEISRELKKIAFKSIDAYLAVLEDDPTLIDMASIQERLVQQIGKLFVSWDSNKQEFGVEVFSNDSMRLSGDVSFKRRPSGERSCLVVMNQAGNPIESLLRWKNRSCLLGPAWQISLRNR